VTIIGFSPRKRPPFSGPSKRRTSVDLNQLRQQRTGTQPRRALLPISLSTRLKGNCVSPSGGIGPFSRQRPSPLSFPLAWRRRLPSVSFSLLLTLVKNALDKIPSQKEFFLNPLFFNLKKKYPPPPHTFSGFVPLVRSIRRLVEASSPTPPPSKNPR